MPTTTEQDVLSQAAEVAFAGVERETDLAGFSRQRQVFIRVYSAQPVIDNGGFSYFFESDWPGKPPYSRFSDAYREIGATDVAEWIDRAASLFGVPDPHLQRDARLRYMNENCRDSSGEFVELGNRAMDESVRVFRLLEEYVQQNAGALLPAPKTT